MARLKKVAEALGLPLSERKKTYNSRRAQELGKWASLYRLTADNPKLREDKR